MRNINRNGEKNKTSAGPLLRKFFYIDMRNRDGKVKRLSEIFKRSEDLVRKEIEEQIGKAEKTAAERNEKYDAALKLAKETGKRQVLSSWMDEQEHVQYVMADGSIKTETYES